MNASLPNLVLKSVSTAALSTRSPAQLQSWIDEIEQRVAEEGKFSKLAVAYLPVSPPPVFWDYKCRKCLAWESPDGCKWVEGEISPRGWCAIWLPDGRPAFSWVGELLRRDW